ncbi:7187_t:CDS:2 [Acaulospora colombiana]|uniref:7187_t:CDS:1 n=1 Tax=Acaulospora colombiana TaxID=27376 RepID=A0ACA9KEY0_9GLOM|nr:7187_t:CDS:2 [Acaulospora colombiana]
MVGEIVLNISMTSDDENRKEALLVELIDTGIGIDPKFITHIWDSFSQEDASATRPHGGTGLGLSICKNLVTINGGKLGVTSELGKGSRFWFTWNVGPVFQVQPVENIQSLSTFLSDKRILVIDPVTTARNSLVRLINNERTDAFDTAKEGTASAKMLRERHNEQYDLVFFNVLEDNVQEVIKAAKELREICGNDNLLIILMVFWSAEGHVMGQEVMKEIGDQVITMRKPITQKRILNYLLNREISKPHNSVESPADLSAEVYHDRNDSQSNSNDAEDVNMLIDEKSSSNDQKSARKPNLKRTTPVVDEDRKLKSRTRLTSKSKCILCVEDNPINLRVIQHQLTRLGYQSLSATNGQEAVNLLAELANYLDDPNSPSNHRAEISLILMDCAMPIMSGHEASKIIRAMKPPISQIPIIALTAEAVLGSKEKCLESGMSDYLTKPLKMEQLEEMLLKWLND